MKMCFLGKQLREKTGAQTHQRLQGGGQRVFTWAAVHSEYGRDYLVGFVTARVVYLYECDPMDRQVMSLASKCLDGDGTVYVLTLGVVPACRQCGIARSLLGLVHQHASRLRCRAIFLHVISYNDAAMRLYGTSGYQVMARLPNFYHLVRGKIPFVTGYCFIRRHPTRSRGPRQGCRRASIRRNRDEQFAMCLSSCLDPASFRCRELRSPAASPTPISPGMTPSSTRSSSHQAAQSCLPPCNGQGAC
ncbi:hypothetical protein Vretimale_7887 [Volvox reticuliferus]|uniref:N-alpha-acetyltransferase 60 n=1 Tax=Volvox reticuliferus TaxID=1737510 RepID=A0A8J4LN30_9CHLO|nr:hypothetical protein Vretimale_7887 [Volvox reticuliferus]